MNWIKRHTSKVKRANHEEQLQMQIADYLARFCPVPWFHVPNGGHRHAAVGAKLKRMGAKAGVPDLLFVLPGGRLAAVELKYGKNDESDAQQEFRETLEHYGVRWARCRSLEEVLDALDRVGVTVQRPLYPVT